LTSHSGSDANDPAREILRTPFALTRDIRSPEGALRRVRRSEQDGLRTWSFDLVTNRQNHGGTQNTASNYSAGVAELRSRLEMRLSLSRRGMFRRPVPLDAPVLEVGSEALRRLFTVHGTSAELAGTVLNDSACAWLLSDGNGFHYEIVHDRVLAYGWRRYLGGGGALDAALGLKSHLPGEQ
jgi:hypothetical protein